MCETSGECSLGQTIPIYPKHLYPKFNGYGDNGRRSLKLWQLLLTYWLPNTYSNWQEYAVSVTLIAVHNIKLTCEWHKAIKLNYKNTRNCVIVVLRLTLRRMLRTHQGHCITMSRCRVGALDKYAVMDGVQYVDTPEAHTFRWPLFP